MPRITALTMILLMPIAMFGADSGPASAVVQGNGIVYVNGQQLTMLTSPVFADDVVQTGDAGVAQVSRPGSSVVIQSNTIMRFRGDGFALDRGTISMATGKMSSVLARDFKITPVSASWTQFDVMRSGGTIQIFARKNNVTVACGTSAPITLKEGQQLSREDGASCGLATNRGGAPVAAKGPILASPTAEKVYLGVGGGLAAWVLFQADEPVSPSAP